MCWCTITILHLLNGDGVLRFKNTNNLWVAHEARKCALAATDAAVTTRKHIPPPQGSRWLVVVVATSSTIEHQPAAAAATPKYREGALAFALARTRALPIKIRGPLIAS